MIGPFIKVSDMKIKPFRYSDDHADRVFYGIENVKLVKDLVSTPEDSREAQEAYSAYIAPIIAKSFANTDTTRIYSQMKIGRTVLNPNAVASLRLSNDMPAALSPEKRAALYSKPRKSHPLTNIFK